VFLASEGFAQSIPRFNEIVVNDVSDDDAEFVEVHSDPGANLTALTIVVIEGESSENMGVIDLAIPLTGSAGPDGLYVLGDPSISCAEQIKSEGFENGGQTFLLVAVFTGAVGQDIDVDDDGVRDGAFPAVLILDSISFVRPSEGDAAYGGWVLGPDTGNDGTGDFDVAGAASCAPPVPWGLICLEGTEGASVCDTNNPFNDYNVTNATPCAPNACGPPVSVDKISWGLLKGQYRE
jgi:hypothetical protein